MNKGPSFFETLRSDQAALLLKAINKEMTVRYERDQSKTCKRIVVGPLRRDLNVQQQRDHLSRLLVAIQREEGKRIFKKIRIDYAHPVQAFIYFENAGDAAYVKNNDTVRRVFSRVEYAKESDEETECKKESDGWLSSLDTDQLQVLKRETGHSQKYNTTTTMLSLLVGPLPDMNSTHDARAYVMDCLKCLSSQDPTRPPTKSIYVSPYNMQEACVRFYTAAECVAAQRILVEKGAFLYARMVEK